MTKIYENDERDKFLPISITINFILRTMFLFIIKRWLYLVFYRLKIQIAWGASLVKNPRPIDADIYQFKLLLRGSAILYSEFNMFIHFFRRGEPCLFFNNRAFQNSNCLERRSFQRRRFWQMICKWMGIAYRLMWK